MVDPKRLIESMEMCKGAERDCHKCMYCETENDCRDSMIYDAVDVFKVMKQAEWERDVALDQLRQIGKGFGEKMDDIVEVLEKHESKTVIVEGSDVAHVGRCPSCHVILTPFRANYCYCCGQAVKWDEAD